MKLKKKSLNNNDNTYWPVLRRVRVTKCNLKFWKLLSTFAHRQGHCWSGLAITIWSECGSQKTTIRWVVFQLLSPEEAGCGRTHLLVWCSFLRVRTTDRRDTWRRKSPLIGCRWWRRCQDGVTRTRHLADWSPNNRSLRIQRRMNANQIPYRITLSAFA